MTRAFVALRPPDEVLDALEALGRHARTLIRPARWTRRDQWHVTIQFLGDHVDVGTVIRALHDVEGSCGPVRLGGVGAFPKERRAGVLWVGVERGVEPLDALARDVGAKLTIAGYPPGARAFHPHVTLARLEPPQDLRTPVSALTVPTVGPEWQPAELVLYASRPHPEGPRYEPLATFALH